MFTPSKESPSLAPELNEPLDGPSYQAGDLSIAYLDDALNTVRPARHVNLEIFSPAEKSGAGLYKASIMRHTSASLTRRIFYNAMFDHNMETNNRRERK